MAPLENKENVKLFSRKYENLGGPIGQKLVLLFLKSMTGLIPKDIRHTVELGCGPGESTRHIHKARPDIILEASDIDPDLVALTKQKIPHITTRVESIYDTGRETESTDLVCALEIFEHLDDPHKALTEVHRITKKYALISVPREPLWRILNICRGAHLKDFGNTPGHVNHWSTGEIKKFVSPLFDIIEVRNPIPWTILLLRKK